MSKLIVEVCQIEEIFPHPNADKLEICRIKGWNVVIQKNRFTIGQKVVFFPPDAVLQPALIDRLGIRNYMHQLPKDEDGNRPEAMKVVSARLRGESSFGTIMPLDLGKGDLDWPVGTDVAEHFNVTKFVPSDVTSAEADVDHSRFFRYTDIENFANYNTAIPDGTEVVYTEKLHGRNLRVGTVLDNDETGEWIYKVGSFDIARKEQYRIESRRFVSNLIENEIIKSIPSVGDIFHDDGRRFQVDEIVPWKRKNKDTGEEYDDFKVLTFEINPHGETIYKASEFWIPVEDLKPMLTYLRDEFEFKENKFSIIVYGELIGIGQDMHYGIENGYDFRVFDISINNQYLDYDIKKQLCDKFDVAMVPILYRGPFSVKSLNEYTSGPTTMCDPKDAGKFKGREGIVVTPVVEVPYCPIVNGRRILKSVSADYHARKGGTEFH